VGAENHAITSAFSQIREEPVPHNVRPAPQRASVRRHVTDRDIPPLADLRGRDLSGRDLSGLDLSGANLDGAILDRVNLAGTRLDRCSAQRARFVGADLREASMVGADLEYAVLDDALLMQARLHGARLPNASFRRADLTGAQLWRVDATDSDFDGTDLTNADAGGGDFTNARFVGAKGDSPNFCGARMQRVDFSSIAWKDARFERSDLTEAIFRSADLRLAQFTMAVLDGAKFEQCELSETVWTGASLDETRVLDSRLDAVDSTVASRLMSMEDATSTPSDDATTTNATLNFGGCAITRADWEDFCGAYMAVAQELTRYGDSPLRTSLGGLFDEKVVSVDGSGRLFVPCKRGYNHKPDRTYLSSAGYPSRDNVGLVRLIRESANEVSVGGRVFILQHEPSSICLVRKDQDGSAMKPRLVTIT
jgi:uncharacterized protein YjbI with pentapeptide repeats